MVNQMLDILTERYFAGETTPEEEALLRSIVVRSPQGQNEDLKAVLGLFSAGMERGRAAAAKKRKLALGFAAAAVVALLVAAGFILNSNGSVCEGWVNGQRVTDSEQLVKGAQDQLDAFFGRSESFDNGLDDVLQSMNNK